MWPFRFDTLVHGMGQSRGKVFHFSPLCNSTPQQLNPGSPKQVHFQTLRYSESLSNYATIFVAFTKMVFSGHRKCYLHSMRIPGLQKYRSHDRDGYFQGLSRELQYVAYSWLNRFVTRWRHDLPPWRLAILVGQAKRLALNPPSSAWGRSMLAKKGGHAVQRKYRIECRHPTKKATQARLLKRAKRQAEDRFKAQYGAYLKAYEGQTSGMRIKHLKLFSD